MNFLRPALSLALPGALLFLTACAPQPAPDTRAADEAAIRKLDAEWVTVAQAHKIDAWLAYYSEDAAILPPNDKIANGREGARKSISGLLSLPGLNISWTPTKVEVARAGDLAYLYGAYRLSFNDAKGKTVNDTGKILEIWKKQADGNWKCAVDTWSSDLPVAQ